MKKFLSILFAILILLSGMHFGLATHICGGELFAAKFSFSGEKVSCGMESAKSDNFINGYYLSTDCCKDQFTYLNVDNEYSPSSALVNAANINELQLFLVPENIFLNYQKLYNTPLADVSHYKADVPGALSPEDICIFRI